MNKKNFLWMLLLVPAFFIAASNPNLNLDFQSSGCADSGDDFDAYNGEQGCPYNYDFSFLIDGDCTLTDVDLNNKTPLIDHYWDSQTAEVWYNNNGIIEMIPKSGFGGDGFLLTLNVRVYFDNGSYEDEWWNCHVTSGSPPYPSPCY